MNFSGKDEGFSIKFILKAPTKFRFHDQRIDMAGLHIL